MSEAGYETAEKRWGGIGPYYAMFPRIFADDVIKKYTKKNEVVLDPFAGRSTAIFSAATQGRIGIGIELNPVGWVYGKTKLFSAEQSDVENRLLEISQLSDEYSQEAEQLPEFFHSCYSLSVRKFLLAARNHLIWRYRPSDWTLMGLLLVYLHGKRGQALSNQMRQTKSMSPEYAIRWWEDQKMEPPEIDPVAFMTKRITWRYAKGRPAITTSRVYLGDCCGVLAKLGRNAVGRKREKVKLLFTSPPYHGVTNYHYDQWIRLWLLGYSPTPSYKMGKHRQRFQAIEEYKQLLETTFRKASHLIVKNSVIYVRTDARESTLNTTRNVLKQVFPHKKLTVVNQPYTKDTQTQLFGTVENKGGEVDLILE